MNGGDHREEIQKQKYCDASQQNQISFHFDSSFKKQSKF